MIEPSFDEVDGECLVDQRSRLLHVKDPDSEKSIDSGMDDGSNSCSLDNGDNTDDDDLLVVKPRKMQKQRIIDDDSDMSQDVPTCASKDVPKESINVLEELEPPKKEEFTEVIDMREKQKQELTQEQALDEIFRDSSNESDDDSNTPAKKKRVKRPVQDSSSEDDDENLSLRDAIKSRSTSKENKDHQDETGDSENEHKKRKVPDNLFDEQHSDSDSSGCRSSGSEVERSDNEQGDEGFDESSIDPKLLAKLKKGAAKKPKSARISKREELQSLHSESQRLVRESRVGIPYHQPAPKSLNDFLERASRKQHEYKVLKGFRDTTKARVIQDILQKTRIQSKPKTQEELDQYSDSDEDWNPEEEKEKKLKERVDEKIRSKIGDGMPLSEIKIVGEDESESSCFAINEEGRVDNDEDLPDISESITDVNDDKITASSLTSKKSDTTSEQSDYKNSSNFQSISEKIDKIPEIESGDKCLEVDACTQLDSSAIDLDKAEQEAASVNNMDNDLMFDWEKPVSQSADENKKETAECVEGSVKADESSMDKSDENKENIDPNTNNVENDQSEAVTPGRKEKTSSPRSSVKKRRKKIAALAGIDLDNVQPCLSGNADTFISLEDSVQAPVNPGVQKLMDRLSKHTAKKEKKHPKDTDISIISKDTVGIDKEELTLNKFTYHATEEEINPLLKLETPGAKLVALKEQLKEKMKARREEARQKRQEVYDLDNEEGGYEAEEEEAEMSEHSDTDVEEEEDFEEQFGEEEMEGDEDEKEKNPFADDEAEEEGDDEDGEEEEEENGEEDDDEEEFNLKLDVSENEESEDEADVGQENDEDDMCKSTDDIKSDAKTSQFKAPEKPALSEKPFSVFGRKNSECVPDTQLQSAQSKTSTLQMPIEDSQDLYGSMLPQIATTQADRPTQPSQEFSFLLEDSQSNILDAEGFLNTKSTGKKQQPNTLFAGEEVAGTQNMDVLLGLCSGKFVASQMAEKDKSSRKSLFDDSSMSNTQGNMEELMGLCSGVFTEKPGTQAEKKGTKRPVAESDEDSIGVYSDKESNHDGDSDDDGEEENGEEEEGDTDHVDSEEEDEERPVKFTGFTVKNKHGKIRQEFVEAEAELSGSEYDSDENLDLAEEDDIMEIEEGDKDAAKMDQDQLRDEVGRIHLKQLIDEDKRELLRYQEMYLQDGDLHSEGGGRIRKFKWSNMGEDDSQQDMFYTGSDQEDNAEETEDFAWRKERYEREQFLKEQQEKENGEADNSQFLKLGKVFLKKQVSLDVGGSVEKSKPESRDTGAETPGFPGSFYKLSKQKRGSFLARSKEALAKIAEMTKPIVNPSAGAKSSGNFTFQVISPDKDRDNEASVKTKQRKAHVPKPVATKAKQPPAKRPKLDTQSSFTEGSIFHHI